MASSLLNALPNMPSAQCGISKTDQASECPVANLNRTVTSRESGLIARYEATLVLHLACRAAAHSALRNGHIDHIARLKTRVLQRFISYLSLTRPCIPARHTGRRAQRPVTKRHIVSGEQQGTTSHLFSVINRVSMEFLPTDGCRTPVTRSLRCVLSSRSKAKHGTNYSRG
jgi:hypothetical protein